MFLTERTTTQGIGLARFPGWVLLSVMLWASFLWAPSVSAQGTQFDAYALVESFTWEEFAEGERLLKESGPLFGIGGSAQFQVYRQLTLKGRLELFGGQVNYNGETWEGDPVTTDANYFGTKSEVDAGWEFLFRETLSLEPFGGLGWRYWLRDLEDTHEASGYLEEWNSLYARVGARGDYRFTPRFKVFAEASLKLPFYNENRAHLSDVGLEDVTVRPGNKPSFYAEMGLKYSVLRLAVFYEGLRFSKSDVVHADHDIGVYQPESSADIFGLNVGVSF